MESASKTAGTNKNAGRKKKQTTPKSAIVSYDLCGKVCKAIHMTASVIQYLTEPPFRFYLVLQRSSSKF